MAKEDRRTKNRQVWQLVERVLGSALARVVYLYGPPGTGKTFAAYRYGRVQTHPYCITLTEETSAAELRGFYLLKGTDGVWHDGPFVRAMREGARLVINEISHASADVLALLFPIFESAETARLTLPTGETITPAPGFHVIVTDNAPPDRLPEPLQDRFSAILRVLEPHPDALADLDPELRALAETALAISDEQRRISARGWKHLQAWKDEVGLELACKLVLGPDRGQMLWDAIQLALATKKGA
jgi:MoxR-like ATPase